MIPPIYFLTKSLHRAFTLESKIRGVSIATNGLSQSCFWQTPFIFHSRHRHRSGRRNQYDACLSRSALRAGILFNMSRTPSPQDGYGKRPWSYRCRKSIFEQHAIRRRFGVYARQSAYSESALNVNNRANAVILRWYPRSIMNHELVTPLPEIVRAEQLCLLTSLS